MSHHAVSCPSSVAKCASAKIRGKVRSAATAPTAATLPQALRRRNATTPHAALKTVIVPILAAVSSWKMPLRIHLAAAIGMTAQPGCPSDHVMNIQWPVMTGCEKAWTPPSGLLPSAISRNHEMI
jgi:hypothetical protein